jgi:hypothetical protein
MSLFGKVLAFLNVLAAIGFFYVATLDWSKGQQWADAAQQHDLVIEGLPIDDAHDKDGAGSPRSQNIPPAVLQRMFSRVGGEPVKTQTDEVKRVQRVLQGKLDDSTTKETKEQKLARVMYALAPSTAEREQWINRYNKPTNNTDDMQAKLDEAFAAVLSDTLPTRSQPDSPAAPKPRDLNEQRRSIALLLLQLANVFPEEEAPDAAANQDPLATKAYERVLTVVGLDACNYALETQVDALERMTKDVLTALKRDRESYVPAHAMLLNQVEELSEKVAKQRADLKVQTEMVEQSRALAEARRTEVARITKELGVAQEETRQQLAIQATMEKNLFDARREVRDAFEKNQQLEQKLQELEKGR